MLDPRQRLAIALAADTTDWSVKRYLEGAKNQNARVRARIETALQAAGYGRLVRTPKKRRPALRAVP